MIQSTRIRPPKWPVSFLRFFVKEEYLEEIEGDMEEVFQDDLDRYSVKKANRRYAWGVLTLFRPSIVKKLDGSYHLNNYDMFTNYFKIAWRNLFKDQMYSIIKIGGFAIGVAACLLIALFVKDELNYDKHYANGDRIYRVINVENNPSDPGKWTAFPAQIAQVLKDDFPEIEQAGRLIPYDWYNAGANQFRREDQVQNNYEEGFAYADQSLLEILEIPMVYGDPQQALADPKTIVISKSKADKYFPDEDPVGRTVILNENESNPYTIGGVMENFPSNSHLQFDFFITLKEVEFWPGEQTNWCCSNYNPYVLLRPGADPRELEKKLLSIRDDYVVRHLQDTGNQYADDAQKYRSYQLQPIGDIHLRSHGIGDIFPHSDIRIVRLFGAIAGFILLLACINFINLATAKSANRAKEVGVRKVSGSFRSHLIQQFLSESVFFSAISVALGTVLARLFLPYFNLLSGKSLHIPFTEWQLIPLLILLTLFIGVLAGIYPSFYLSAFKPVEVLKGNLSRGSKNSSLRSVMVVFQFTTSIVLIVGAFIVYRQMAYILNKKLGYNKEQVVMIQGAGTLGEKATPFKTELLRLPEVENATFSNYLPVSGTKRDQNSFWKEGRSKIDKSVGAQTWWTDEDYIETMKMNLIKGRGFSREMASDSAAIIINQAMAQKLGLEKPIGARIMNWRTWTVIGVVADFHFESMKEGIGPLAFILGSGGSIISARIQADNISKALTSIESVWDEFMPNQPIRYTFLDETYARMYEDVQRTGNIFASCALLAIIIACLGLFGLSTFMAEQRSKEISIRKVLGASISNVFRLLTFNFLKFVFISLLIGTPIAWYLMRKWLEDFTYSINVAWWFFAASGLIVLGIALLTVSRQALKLSLANPVDFLKNE